MVIPFPRKRRHSWWPFVIGALLFFAILLFAIMARAQIPAQGQPALNQALAARLLTKSDTATIVVTRGIYIGDAAACNVALRLAGDSAGVTFTNVVSGTYYPFSIVQLLSTGTTCASVIALY